MSTEVKVYAPTIGEAFDEWCKRQTFWGTVNIAQSQGLGPFMAGAAAMGQLFASGVSAAKLVQAYDEEMKIMRSLLRELAESDMTGVDPYYVVKVRKYLDSRT